MLKPDHKVVIGYTTINVIGVTTVFVKYPNFIINSILFENIDKSTSTLHYIVWFVFSLYLLAKTIKHAKTNQYNFITAPVPKLYSVKPCNKSAEVEPTIINE